MWTIAGGILLALAILAGARWFYEAIQYMPPELRGRSASSKIPEPKQQAAVDD